MNTNIITQTNNRLQIVNQVFNFKNTNFTIITNEQDGSIYFIGKEIATALGYADTAQAVRTHCRGVVNFTTPSISGNQVYKIIPESDVYRLVMKSNKAEAEVFQDWVMDEVLPAIRSKGYYSIQEQKPLTQAEFLLQQAQMFVEQERKMAALEQKTLAVETKLQTVEDKISDVIGTNDYFTVVGYMSHNRIRLAKGSEKDIGKIATKISKELLIEIRKVKDAKFYEINSYREDVLSKAVDVYRLAH